MVGGDARTDQDAGDEQLREERQLLHRRVVGIFNRWGVLSKAWTADAGLEIARRAWPPAEQKHSRHAVASLCISIALACSSEKDTTAEVHAFIDEQGRQCRATLEKTSPSAPSLSVSVSCEGEGRQCSGESSPCF